MQVKESHLLIWYGKEILNILAIVQMFLLKCTMSVRLTMGWQAPKLARHFFQFFLVQQEFSKVTKKNRLGYNVHKTFD